MPLEQCDAIVLRIYPWSETSCIATLFTRDHGKIAALAKGARRPKSPFEAALDLLSICRVVFISKSADALDILTEAKLTKRFRAGSKNLLRLYCGYYVAELLDRLTEKGDQHTEIFDLARVTLENLEREELEPSAIVLRFELQILRYLGHLPSWNRCVHCGKELSSDDVEPVGSQTEAWVIFSSFSGGILCDACHQGGRLLQRISTATLRLLVSFSQPDWQRLDVSHLPPQDRPAVRKLILRYLTFLLDSPLKLEPYLEELGR